MNNSPSKKSDFPPPQKMEGLYYIEVEPYEDDFPDINIDKVHRFRVRRILVRLTEIDIPERREDYPWFLYPLPWAPKYKLWAQPETMSVSEDHLYEECRPPCKRPTE